jgi:hypothetical protein
LIIRPTIEPTIQPIASSITDTTKLGKNVIAEFKNSFNGFVNDAIHSTAIFSTF